MARRVSDYRIRRIAELGNEEDGSDSRARGDRFYHNRRSTDRGNEKADPEKDLRARVATGDEEGNRIEIRRLGRYEPRFDEDEVVNAYYEEAPVFDDDKYEAATENISAQQDIQEELPTDEVQDNPIETSVYSRR
nr:nucleotide-binding alpha-beta plait domain-containing protein [Tanacetum cinerariifolium]